MHIFYHCLFVINKTNKENNGENLAARYMIDIFGKGLKQTKNVLLYVQMCVRKYRCLKVKLFYITILTRVCPQPSHNSQLPKGYRNCL